MKFLNNINEISASFVAKEHSKALGNCEACGMHFHVHSSAELLMVLSGELTVTVLGRKPEKIPRGYCALIFPFQSHSYERPEGTEYFRFNFAPSLTRSFFSPNENNVGEKCVFRVDLTEYLSFFNQIRFSKISLYKVKGFLYNVIGDYSASISLVKKYVDENILSKVIHYLDENKGERVTITETALALGYNDKYLSRAINTTAGFGFSTLLSMLRMDAASHLLRETDRTVVDIAIECGFGSERNFYRKFKEFTGLTPKEFRDAAPQRLVIYDAAL